MSRISPCTLQGWLSVCSTLDFLYVSYFLVCCTTSSVLTLRRVGLQQGLLSLQFQLSDCLHSSRLQWHSSIFDIRKCCMILFHWQCGMNLLRVCSTLSRDGFCYNIRLGILLCAYKTPVNAHSCAIILKRPKYASATFHLARLQTPKKRSEMEPCMHVMSSRAA